MSEILENSTKSPASDLEVKRAAVTVFSLLRLRLALFSCRYHAAATAVLGNKGFSLLENKRGK